LERYAYKEGAVFLKRFMRFYKGLSSDEILEKVTARTRKGMNARTILFRAIRPKAKFKAYVAYMKNVFKKETKKEKLKELFRKYPPDRYALVDQGYITGINPLELWLVSYKLAHSKASDKKLLARSHVARLESYAWLLRSGKKKAQDTRIRILLEQDAFMRIQKRWARLGYPFERLVPSLATAIGTSADRPAALVELVGILLNDGVRRPMRRIEGLHFAKGTPYETIIKPNEKGGERVLDPAVARVIRAAMTEVAEKGTARRLRGAYVDVIGQPLVVGAKTGTGDHRYEEYGPHHHLISSRVVNRTGTIAFFIGDRFFGAVTAHVAGEKAANYKFTSALSAQMLKSLAPSLQPLITPEGMLLPIIIEGKAPDKKTKENLLVKS
ncbi:MAG TPA: glycosyl transferase family 51, partial [Rhodospirillaceae bacterium]|nr:glycosyl transferase family 51 [Rhodospirillaceae bacterium]